MKKSLLTVFILVAVMVFGVMSTFIMACAEKEEQFPTWDISSNGSQITASFSDNGKYGYILTITGSGAMSDYASAKDAPWNSKAGRITGIAISEGITYIGANSFTGTAIKAMVLPQSVNAMGENAFPSSVKVYAYAKVSNDDNVYVYSENEPTTAGNYWHYVNDIVTVWPNGEVKTQKILFIGNSYTYYNDMPEKIFEPFAKAAGANVTVTSITEGSRRFSEWSNPNNEYGARVEAALTAANDYDIIVLQDRSVSPLSEYNTSLEGVKTLANRIRETQTDCKIYLYQTWGNPSSQGNYGGSIPEMEARLRTAYEGFAAEIGATVSYVGKAFTYVYETYNLATLGKDSPYWLYQDDNSHPLYMGSYLAACVHTATLLGIDPRTSTFNGSLDTATATLMKEIAYNIVFGTTS